MAHRDRSQGFGFVYVDIKDLLKRRDELFGSDAPVPSEEVAMEKPLHFPKVDETPTQPDLKVEAREKSVAQIKGNLDRLQNLHHKLHAMLDELNQITKKKK